jgi:hypothetical protein
MSMGHDIAGVARRLAKTTLARMNLRLTRIDAPFEDYRSFIPFKQTVAAARESGLSVGDYIEAHYDTPEAARDTLRQLAALGVFDGAVNRICEIGPGSGRYLRETLRYCTPAHYEVYETARQWAQWLSREYRVVLLPADGRSLPATATESVDLVQAHKVLPGQPFLVTCRYLAEMARVARVGGKVVFDLVTEDCMNMDVLECWLKSGSGYQHYPNMIPKGYALALCRTYGLRCDGHFLESMKPGVTQCFVFSKVGTGHETPADRQ